MHHTVLLRSDGHAVACGKNDDGQCDIPSLDKGISYRQVSAGGCHTVLLRSDGEAAAACGREIECSIPSIRTFEQGIFYTQVSAGGGHTVLLRNDGQAVACGRNDDGQCNIPPSDEGIVYTQVSAGDRHTVLLRSDGQAVAFGFGPFSIPPLEEGIVYTQVSAGGCHTVLLRSDGQAVACGRNDDGQCSIHPLEKGVFYCQVSAGGYHTVLLRSDGQAVACGFGHFGQCNIPSLDKGISYREVSAGGCHTVLLRSDGRVVACGKNENGQCNIPSWKYWHEWFFASRSGYFCNFWSDRIVQLDFLYEGDLCILLRCLGLDGHELLCLKAQKTDLAVDVYKRLVSELVSEVLDNTQGLQLVLPDGQLFASENSRAKLGDVISCQKHAYILRKGVKLGVFCVKQKPYVSVCLCL